MPSRIRPPHAPGHRRGRRGVRRHGPGRPHALGHWRGKRGARRRGSGRPRAPGHWRGRRRGAPPRIQLPPCLAAEERGGGCLAVPPCFEVGEGLCHRRRRGGESKGRGGEEGGLVFARRGREGEEGGRL